MPAFASGLARSHFRYLRFEIGQFVDHPASAVELRAVPARSGAAKNSPEERTAILEMLPATMPARWATCSKTRSNPLGSPTVIETNLRDGQTTTGIIDRGPGIEAAERLSGVAR